MQHSTVLKLHQKSYNIGKTNIYISNTQSNIIHSKLYYIEQLLLTPKVNEKLIKSGGGTNQ